MSERFFAPCPRGLETALAAELTRIGAVDVTITEGGAGFAGELALAYRANLESRIASRILWRVGGGPYRDEHGLYELVRAIDWTRHFLPTRTLRVDIAATRSPLQSLEFATLRVKDAVCDRFRADTGVRPSIDKRAPDVRVSAYLTERDATIYVDTSGEPLFKRGYRRDAEEAPLRENLAAGLLALTGWTPSLPLLDPMCGSGTIAVEAALIAADRAPGLARTFGFQKLAWFDGPAWQRLKQTARDRCAARPATPTIRERPCGERRSPRRSQPADRAGRRVRSRRAGGPAVTRRARRPRHSAVQSALRRKARRSGPARALLSVAGRRAETALSRLDRVFLHGRPAVAEADSLEGRAQDAALQWRTRVPVVRVSDRVGAPCRGRLTGRCYHQRLTFFPLSGSPCPCCRPAATSRNTRNSSAS